MVAPFDIWEMDNVLVPEGLGGVLRFHKGDEITDNDLRKYGTTELSIRAFHPIVGERIYYPPVNKRL